MFDEKPILLVCLCLIFIRIDVSLSIANDDFFTVTSKYSVNQTIELITKNVLEQSGKIFCRIDQLDETVLILFGNPRVGTQLMVENGSVWIQLPLRASVWKRN